MNLKKSLALLLSAVLLLSAISGCGGKTGSDTGTGSSTESGIDLGGDVQGPIEGISGTGTSDASGTSSTSDGTDTNHDFDKAYSAYSSDTVMAVVDGENITWQPYFYWLYRSLSNFEENYMTITDFSAICYDDVTYGQFIIENALDAATYYKAVEKYAAELGIALSADDEAEIKSNYDSTVEQAGGEEAFAEYLKSVYCTSDYYNYIMRCQRLNSLCLAQNYGENGEKLSESDILAYASENGYMMAKHILFLTTDSSGNALSDDEKAAVLKKAEGVLAQLDAAAPDEVSDLFDKLMNENSEDPGLSTFPDGYLFQSGEMMSEFEDAVTALKEGEYSRIVETSYGYHIIMRIPINADVTPMAYSQYLSYGYSYPLRYVVAKDLLNNTISERLGEMDIQQSDELKALDLSKIF